MKLEGKTAIITGATGGLGSAVARDLDQAGVNLVLTGREPGKLEALGRDLSQRNFSPAR